MVSDPIRNGATLQRWIKPLISVLGVVVFFCLIAITVLAIQLGKSDKQLDDIDDAVKDIQSFVTELREEREARDEGVSTEELRVVFGLIRDQLTLLCTQFPDDPVCAQG